MTKLFAEEPDILICFDCDSEFTITPVSVDEESEISCCPYCGANIKEEDDYDEEEQEEDE